MTAATKAILLLATQEHGRTHANRYGDESICPDCGCDLNIGHVCQDYRGPRIPWSMPEIEICDFWLW
jgi:hypothetical protein